MSEFRMGRNTTEHYTSFEECAKAWGCKSIVKNHTDEKEKQKKDISEVSKN